MTKIRMAFAGALAVLVTLLAPVAVSAAPVKAAASICDTSGRDNAEYRRKCMVRGTIADAARDYYLVTVGRKGHETRDGWDRRSVCKFSWEYGGIRPAVRELWFDGSYDRYFNHLQVLRWVGEFAAHDCRAMGYRV